MAEGGRPAVKINFHYQEGTIITEDNVGQRTDVHAANIHQIVVPTAGNSQSEDTQPDTLQHDSISAEVLKESEVDKVKSSSSDRGLNDQTTAPRDVTDNIGRMNLTEGMHFVTSENLRRLINKSEFSKALNILQDISTSQEQQFMMSECYCQLGIPDKALRCIEALQSIMTSSPKPSVDDVIKLVENYIADSSHIRASILLSCCAMLYKFDSNPNNSVVGIRDCSLKCRELIEKMVGKGDKMKVIARDVGLKIITDMLRELKSVSGADKNMEARCLINVGVSYVEVGKYKEAIGFYSEGLDLMNQTFGSNAEKYRVFGDLLNNIGYAYDYLKDYSKAESFYLQSLDAYKKAEDWSKDKVKREMIKNTKTNLEIT